MAIEMLAAAWKNKVKVPMISNCFQKAGFIWPDISKNDAVASTDVFCFFCVFFSPPPIWDHHQGH
jgi:hypothetical protein